MWTGAGGQRPPKPDIAEISVEGPRIAVAARAAVGVADRHEAASAPLGCRTVDFDVRVASTEPEAEGQAVS
jgi:hypothetical protein